MNCNCRGLIPLRIVCVTNAECIHGIIDCGLIADDSLVSLVSLGADGCLVVDGIDGLVRRIDLTTPESNMSIKFLNIFVDKVNPDYLAFTGKINALYYKVYHSVALNVPI